MECLLIEETDNFLLCISCLGFCRDPLGCLDSFLVDPYCTLDEEEELKKKAIIKLEQMG